MLGNVVSMQKIYDRINLAIQQNNTLEIYYQFGRIMNLLLIFEPVVSSSITDRLAFKTKPNPNEDDTKPYDDHFKELVKHKI
jgi:hypothetical protein